MNNTECITEFVLALQQYKMYNANQLVFNNNFYNKKRIIT